MTDRERRIHRNMMIGWSLIVGVLLVSYFGEMLKGERTPAYFLHFVLVTVFPYLLCCWLHKTRKFEKQFSVILICGYFIMYTFVLMTGKSTLVFAYILPMLSFLPLFHRSKLILWTGFASLMVNLLSVLNRLRNGEITLANSRDVEIQIALIVLCFVGAWVSSRMYDRMTVDNSEYRKQVDEQNEQLTNQKLKLSRMEMDMADIAEKAHTDLLTNIGNRLAFEQHCSAIRDCSLFGVIYCDANGLKVVNDMAGHDAGDRILIQLASVLTHHFRQAECFRLSGDEFAVVVSDLDPEVFTLRAKQVRNHLRTSEPPLAAVGWSCNNELEEALKNAEAWMYHDKSAFYLAYPQYKR